MKKIIDNPTTYLMVCLIAIIIMFVTACASEQYVPATPTSPATTNYVPNMTAMQISGVASQISQDLPAPYGTIVNAGAALLVAIAGIIAVKKNNDANNHSDAAAALASVIAGNPTLSAQAMANAAINDSVASVSAHLTNANKPV
jgi:Ca2+/H+ antiporter